MAALTSTSGLPLPPLPPSTSSRTEEKEEKKEATSERMRDLGRQLNESNLWCLQLRKFQVYCVTDELTRQPEKYREDTFIKYLQVPKEHIEFYKDGHHHCATIKNYTFPISLLPKLPKHMVGVNCLNVSGYKLGISFPRRISVGQVADKVMEIVRKINLLKSEFAFMERADNREKLLKEEELPETEVLVYHRYQQDLLHCFLGKLLPPLRM